MVAFPADAMRILGYHRVVRDLGGRTSGEFLAALEPTFEVQPLAASTPPARAHCLAMYLAGGWYRLALRQRPPASAPLAARLDAQLLTTRLLTPLLGITDVRSDPRVDFVSGARGLGALARRVDSGEMAAGFALYPVAMAQLMAVADAGATMPPKSTWFEPKLADGLVSYPLD